MPTICGRGVIATKNSPASIHAGRTRLSSHVGVGRSPTSDSKSVSLFLRVVVDVADVAGLLEIGRALGLHSVWLQYKPLKDPRTGVRVAAWHWDLWGERLRRLEAETP